MKKLFTLIFCMFFAFSFSQLGGEDEVYLSADKIEPTFNGGGLDKFYEFINKEFNFSKVTKAGTMVTSFTINEIGEIKDIRVLQFVDVESATEIIRVLKKAPKWIPAKKKGNPYSVTIKFPLEFKLLEKKPLKEEIEPYKEVDEKIIKTENVEVKPEFEGGMNAFYKFIGENFRTPDIAGIKSRIIISFVVEKDGSLTDFKIVKDDLYNSGNEAIRVLKKSPLWIPAYQNGIPVRCSFMLPIVIQSQK